MRRALHSPSSSNCDHFASCFFTSSFSIIYFFIFAFIKFLETFKQDAGILLFLPFHLEFIIWKWERLRPEGLTLVNWFFFPCRCLRRQVKTGCILQPWGRVPALVNWYLFSFSLNPWGKEAKEESKSEWGYPSKHMQIEIQNIDSCFESWCSN